MSAPKGKSWIRRITVILVALLVGAGLVIWMTRAFNVKVKPGKVAVSYAKVQPGHKTWTVQWVETALVDQAVGTVQAKHHTVVASKLLARVEQVKVRAGDMVKVGQLLIVLDTREWTAKKAAAQAALEAARADLELRMREYERMRSLLARRAASQQDFDVVAARRDAALAMVKRARQEILVVDSALAFTRIRAPVSGKIIERAVEPGDMALPGKPLLTMYDPSDLRLEARVRESLIPHIKVGQHLKVQVESIGLQTIGVVEEIVPQAYAATRTFIVKVSIPRTQGLYPGMFGRLTVPYGTRKRLLIPRTAVRRVGQVELVELVQPDNTIVRQQIKTGQSFDHMVEVLSGLNPPSAGSPPQRILIP